MATNLPSGDGHRNGSVKGRSQVFNSPKNQTYVKKNSKTGTFVLINSPIYIDSTPDNENYLPPLGLGYIATNLEKSGIKVNLVDSVKAKMSVADIINLLNVVNGDYIGINVFTANKELVKKIYENTITKAKWFFGGKVVKDIYEEIISWRNSNEKYIIVGEGEYVIPEIVSGNYNESYYYEDEKSYVCIIDKDSKYFPGNIDNTILDHHFFENEVLMNHYGEREASIITSRGCPYNCAFCGGANEVNKNIPIRFRTNNNIKKEIDNLVSQYPNLSYIRILDDLFIRDRDSIKNAYQIFNHYSNLYWRGMAHIVSLAKCIDEIETLKRSKCKELFFGIESGCERIRRFINKAGDVNLIKKVIFAVLDQGIDVKGYFIVGFPTETKSDIELTLKLVKELKKYSEHSHGNFRSSVFQFRPYHGTALYNYILENQGYINSTTTNPIQDTIPGRGQFNIISGNYSAISEKEVQEYIRKMQEI